VAETGDVVLITGAGSGMGQEVALHLAGQGYRVYGGVLNGAEERDLRAEAARRGVKLCPAAMDVTNREQIEATVNGILRTAGRIDILIHFAGLGLRGFFEDLGMDEVRRVFDVNVFGIMELTQVVLPHMREQRSGRIVIVSSAAGRMGTLTIAGYCSTKFAVEGFAEVLAQEVRPFNIRVSLVEPGLIQTPHFTVNRNRARKAVDPAGPYYAWFCQHEHMVDTILARQSFTEKDVARVVHRIVTSRNPRLRYPIGINLKLVLTLRRYIPGEWFDRVYFAMVRRLVTKPKVQAKGLSGMP
jgi:NAD(P)-dependent dehydrogenase (short-subunit alcohol dehydrogenase family)